MWTLCLEAASALGAQPLGQGTLLREDIPRYGGPQRVAPRLGQGTFRVAVLEAYSRACCVTGEHSLPALEASHIRPFATSQVDAIHVGAAWVFVRFRALHSAVHCTVNVVILQFTLYLVATLAVWLMLFRAALGHFRG